MKMPGFFSCRQLTACYQGSPVVQDVSFTLRAGEIMLLSGSDGAGKSALLRTIARRLEPQLTSGEIWLGKKSLHDKHSFEAALAGIQLVPEGRRVIPGLTVQENLDLARIPGQEGWNDARIFDFFPQLGELRKTDGDVLDTAGQQMLAIARALSRDLTVLLLDEPCAGLAPDPCQQIQGILQLLRDSCVAVIIASEHVSAPLDLIDRIGILEEGRLSFHSSTVEEFQPSLEAAE